MRRQAARKQWATTLVVAFGVAVSPAIAQETAPLQTTPLDHAELRVGVKQAPPFVVKQGDGQWSGLAVDLWRRMASLTQLNYVLVEQPSAGALVEAAESGRIDVGIGAITVTADRERRIDFTLPYFNAGLGIATQRAEGGLLTTDDPDLMARAIILSGSYMLYERHGAAPEAAVFERIRLETPNNSGRMDNLRAAILLPQIAALDANVERWNARYRALEDGLRNVPVLHLPVRPPEEHYVGSSFQFLIPGIAADDARRLVADARDLGVELKWFGAAEPSAFTSSHHSWTYLEPQVLPHTDHVLAGLFDMRIPLTFSVDDCRHSAEIIAHWADRLALRGGA
mgnify:CR=1 FL=1